jgi:hypothetical protein
MTAPMLAVRRSAGADLERFLAAAKQGRVPATLVQRPVIRMQRGPDGPLWGMFFGAGAVYHGVNFCRRYVHRVGLKGEIGPAFAMVVFIMRGMFGERSKLLPPLNTSGGSTTLRSSPRCTRLMA